MEDRKIIETIRKVLALSQNNPSVNEAKAAALKAQKLMAKYRISLEQVSVKEKEEISEKCSSVGTGNKWKYTLAGIIARNFRCKTFSYGSDTVVFYGFETDTEIASMTFEALYNCGNKAATNYYQNERNKAQRDGRYFCGRGLKNAFLIGFMDGVRSELEKQSVALMIIVPKEVDNAYTERSRTFKKRSAALRYRTNEDAMESGRRLGRDSVRARQLASATT